MYSSMSSDELGVETIDLVLPDADDVLVGAVAEAFALVRVPVDQSLAGHLLQPAGGFGYGQSGPDGHGFRPFGEDGEKDGHLRFVLGEEPPQDAELDAALGRRESGRQVVQMLGQTPVDVLMRPHGRQNIVPAAGRRQGQAMCVQP